MVDEISNFLETWRESWTRLNFLKRVKPWFFLNSDRIWCSFKQFHWCQCRKQVRTRFKAFLSEMRILFLAIFFQRFRRDVFRILIFPIYFPILLHIFFSRKSAYSICRVKIYSKKWFKKKIESFLSRWIWTRVSIHFIFFNSDSWFDSFCEGFRWSKKLSKIPPFSIWISRQKF